MHKIFKAKDTLDNHPSVFIVFEDNQTMAVASEDSDGGQSMLQGHTKFLYEPLDYSRMVDPEEVTLPN